MTTGISIGSGVRTFGEYSNIPEQFQAAIRAGINFIEIETERPLHFGRQIMGPFNVSAREEYNTIGQRTDYIVDWLTGDKASIRFDLPSGKAGPSGKTAKAYMPDDKFWHNRVMVCDNPDLQRITAYHTREGMFPGAVILAEINALYEEITVPAVEYTIYNAMGRPVGSFESRAAAEQDIKQNGYKNHEVRERAIRAKSPAVLAMMREWRTGHRSRFGWTDCREFSEIQNKVAARVKAMQTSAPLAVPSSALDPEQLNAAIVAAIRRMPVEERKKLIESTTKEQVQEKVFNGKLPRYLSLGELKELAKKHEIDLPHRANRKTIISRLREKGLEMTDEGAELASEAARSAPPAEPAAAEEEEVVR